MVDLYNMYADAEAALLLQFKISRTSNPNGNLITWNDPKLMCSNWEILTCSESGNVQVLWVALLIFVRYIGGMGEESKCIIHLLLQTRDDA